MALGGDEASSSNTKKIIEEKNDEGIETPFSALIVDDDPFLRNLHSVMLKSVGLTSQTVQNGKEAVDIFRSGAKFDIIFMDMEMPIMDGIEATKELRAMGVTCKIVGATSCTVVAKKQAFFEAGLNFLHEKPLTVAKVMSCLRQPQN